ncbi:MAG TPA: PIG-L family deacetylase, partial [Spongiibacteraceae bacterium]|nr:PIG-L family deacetylase [Spongiibacteraceae bacterium]
MANTIRTIFENSLSAIRPSHFDNAIAAAPFVDISTLIPMGRRIVVIAPHPDDEVLGCGGILAAAAERNNPVALIAVTDGEACYPASPNCTAQQLAAIRRAESMEGLRRLGLLPTEIKRLGVPDGEIEKHAGLLAQRLQHLLRPDDVVITTWRFDGHSDHDTVGQIAAEVADARAATLLEMPIWAWHTPPRMRERLLDVKVQHLALTTRWDVRKKYALAAYASQVRPPAPLPRAPALQP